MCPVPEMVSRQIADSCIGSLIPRWDCCCLLALYCLGGLLPGLTGPSKVVIGEENYALYLPPLSCK
jgi:hypothetical protein